MSREAVVNRLMKIQADLAFLKWMVATNVGLTGIVLARLLVTV